MMMAREGVPFLGGAFLISIVVGFLGGIEVGFVSLILPVFVGYFFRNPHRIPPENPQLVVSPADGRILSITEVMDERYLHQRMKRVTIFLSIFDVHINRIPFSGRVKDVIYRPGKFLIGFAEKASLDNEQNGVILEVSGGQKMVFVQIAGFVARRIVCYLKAGDEVKRGERFGLIRFGSRMDVYLPLGSEILVKEGDKVVGGETPIAKI